LDSTIRGTQGSEYESDRSANELWSHHVTWGISHLISSHLDSSPRLTPLSQLNQSPEAITNCRLCKNDNQKKGEA
jgi:hypothetical protein